MEVLTNLIVAIILPYVPVSNHVLLKLTYVICQYPNEAEILFN